MTVLVAYHHVRPSAIDWSITLGKAYPEFQRGDALFFVSHKYHSVDPVVEGTRRVLICELWHGPERRCAHRCLQRRDQCDYSRGQARMELMVKGAVPDIY